MIGYGKENRKAEDGFQVFALAPKQDGDAINSDRCKIEGEDALPLQVPSEVNDQTSLIYLTYKFHKSRYILTEKVTVRNAMCIHSISHIGPLLLPIKGIFPTEYNSWQKRLEEKWRLIQLLFILYDNYGTSFG